MRPALDLLMQIGPPPEGDIVDLACGDGAAAPSLRVRLPDRRVIGVDTSAAMLAKAQDYHATYPADIATWSPEARVAILFSNAALYWLPDHAGLLPRRAGRVVPGGTLAVQMPRQ